MSGDKGKVVAGVFIGIVLGIAAAGGVAWYVLQKSPATFVNKDAAKPAPQVAALPASAPVAAPVVPTAPAASGVADTKQHFEFYKVLTDKQDGTARKSSEKPAAKPKEPAAAKPQPAPAAASKEMFYVQAGSFQNMGDAEKLKAKLAFSGFEASIQTATIPDKGVWHRVRLGPYNGNEAGKTVAALKQNGIIATQVHAQ
ncbi:MAG TPA: SPOR domain-containing protein [Sideroxyarcus sp.]|nr:SPOR domain-containing protein [Sideroxyarcus sp.]